LAAVGPPALGLAVSTLTVEITDGASPASEATIVSKARLFALGLRSTARLTIAPFTPTATIRFTTTFHLTCISEASRAAFSGASAADRFAVIAFTLNCTLWTTTFASVAIKAIDPPGAHGEWRRNICISVGRGGEVGGNGGIADGWKRHIWGLVVARIPPRTWGAIRIVNHTDIHPGGMIRAAKVSLVAHSLIVYRDL